MTRTFPSPMSSASDTIAQGTPPQQPPEMAAEYLSEKLEKTNISSSSFSIWPPTQRTRDVISSLIETLSTPSVLSKRYGSMPHDDAFATARAIEEEAYATAATSAAGVGGGDPVGSAINEGIEILKVYSKEISKRMLEAVKSRATANVTPHPVSTEEVSSVDIESSS